MSNEIRPTRYQMALMAIQESVNLLVHGGRGGGKTRGYCFIIMRHLEKYGQDARVLILRKELRGTSELWDDLLLLGAAFFGDVRPNKNERMIRIPNGGFIKIAHLTDYRDYQALQGQSFTLLVVDEGTQITEWSLVNQVQSNLRSTNPNITPRTILATNPGGPSHNHIHGKYIVGHKPHEVFTVDGKQWIHSHSTYRDNEFLPNNGADYRRQLEGSSAHDPVLQRQWIDGSWESATGLMFPHFNAAVHVIPRHLLRTMEGQDHIFKIAADWGLSSPSVALLGIKLNKVRVDQHYWRQADRSTARQRGRVGRGI